MKIWNEFVQKIEEEIGHDASQKWLKALKVVHFDAGNLYLEASDCFQINWFEEYIRPKARKYLVNNNQRPIKIHLSLVGEEKKEKPKVKKEWIPPFILQSDSLDPLAILDLFIPGKKDTISFSLFKAVLERKEVFNPLFLVAPPSSGKTHLLMAACHFLQTQGLNCFYIRAETFTQHLISAIRNGTMNVFREAYRKLDALLIDDIETIGGRDATQEELFHTFNSLHGKKKLLLFSSTSTPSSLKEVEPRLTSRFEWGLSLSFHRLEKEELVYLLEIRQEKIQFFLSQEVFQFLLSSFSSSPKSLLKAFDALVLRAHQEGIDGAQIKIEKAKHMLLPLLVEEQKSLVKPDRIIKAVAEFFGIKQEDILGKSHLPEFTLPRQIAVYLCRSILAIPYTKLGKLFERDHSTMIASFQLIEDKLKDRKSEISTSIAKISRNIKGI